VKASPHVAIGSYTFLAPSLLTRLRALRSSILNFRAFLLGLKRVVGNRPFHLTHNSEMLFTSYLKRQSELRLQATSLPLRNVLSSERLVPFSVPTHHYPAEVRFMIGGRT
jgi:hypothetical protein